MLTDLQARGFSIIEAKATLTRLRNRMIDPVDRVNEADDGGAASSPAWEIPETGVGDR